MLWKSTLGERTTSSFIVEEVTDTSELARAREQDARFQKNWEWFRSQAEAIYKNYRGKCLAVAGQELFVADTPAEAITLARMAHPEDDGLFTRIIPLEKAARIYVNRG